MAKIEITETFVIIEHTHPRTGEVTYPVARRVVKRDGNVTMVQSEKIIAKDLEDFKARYPRETVLGTPTQDQVSIAVKNMTDEQLAQLGLSRGGPLNADVAKLFASPDALSLAAEQGDAFLAVIQDMAGTGSGPNGKFKTSDVKLLIEEQTPDEADDEE